MSNRITKKYRFPQALWCFCRKAWAFLYLFVSVSIAAQSNPYSLEISNLDVKNKDKNSITLIFDLNNIGDEDIELPYQTPFSDIEINFENTLKSKSLIAYHYQIIEKLRKSKLTLPTGAVKSSWIMKFPLQKKEMYREIETKKPIMIPKILDSTKVLIVNDSIKTSTNDTTNITKETITFVKTIIDTALKKPILLDTIIKVNERNCANFVIDSVWIVNQKTKSVKVGFTVKNIGNLAVKLWGETPLLDDNLSAKAYLSSLDHFAKSAYALRGLYIQDEANIVGGILEPMQKITAQMEVSLKDKTKFTPFILLEINTLQNIEECESIDNFKAIRLN